MAKASAASEDELDELDGRMIKSIITAHERHAGRVYDPGTDEIIGHSN